MQDTPKVSIIIPLADWNKHIDKCIEHCNLLDYPDYEILVLPDNHLSQSDNRVRVISTGHIGPAMKRNIGLKQASGEIIAFIDDDTYPTRDWLKNAMRNFNDPEIGAVGGPSVTPDIDTIRQKASGAIYESLFGGGTYRYRYIPQKKRIVDDYPSCNFIVKKDILDQLGGFQTDFWPGEDTALCMDIVYKLGKKILYDPDAVIYHHRRPLFKGHLRQVKAYALHRGYFAKRFPKTSFRLSYFLPSIFVSYLVLGWLLNLKLYLTIILIYLFSIFISIVRFKDLRILTFLGIISTHITYGIWFIIGLLSRRLKEEG